MVNFPSAFPFEAFVPALFEQAARPTANKAAVKIKRFFHLRMSPLNLLDRNDYDLMS